MSNENQLSLLAEIEKGQAAIEAAERAANEEWKENIRALILVFARRNTPFTTDDLIETYEGFGDAPQTKEYRALGGIIQKARRAGTIVEIKMVPSRRRLGTRIPLYQGNVNAG